MEAVNRIDDTLHAGNDVDLMFIGRMGIEGLRHLDEGCERVAVKRRPLLLTSVNCVTNNNFKFLVRHDQILLWRNLFDLHYIRLNSPESTGWRREKGLLFRTFFVCVGCSSKENTSQQVAYMKMIPDIHITKTISSSYNSCSIAWISHDGSAYAWVADGRGYMGTLCGYGTGDEEKAG